MQLEPGPMQVVRNAFGDKDDVLDDLKRLDLWPTTYVSERMEELPMAVNLLEELIDLRDPDSSPLRSTG